MYSTSRRSNKRKFAGQGSDTNDESTRAPKRSRLSGSITSYADANTVKKAFSLENSKEHDKLFNARVLLDRSAIIHYYSEQNAQLNQNSKWNDQKSKFENEKSKRSVNSREAVHKRNQSTILNYYKFSDVNNNTAQTDSCDGMKIEEKQDDGEVIKNGASEHSIEAKVVVKQEPLDEYSNPVMSVDYNPNVWSHSGAAVPIKNEILDQSPVATNNILYCNDNGHYFSCIVDGKVPTMKSEPQDHGRNLPADWKFKSETCDQHSIDEKPIDIVDYISASDSLLTNGIDHATGNSMINYTAVPKVITEDEIESRIELHCFKCNLNSILKRKGMKLMNNCPECHSRCQFQCLKCKRSYSTLGRAKNHVNLGCYPKESFSCNDCDYVTSRKRSLLHHQLSHYKSSSQSLKPESSGDTSSTVGKILRHTQENKSVNEESGKICLSHTKKVAQADTYYCNECDYKASCKRQIQTHIFNQHGLNLGINHCLKCGKIYERAFSLQQHQLTCGLVDYKCTFCDKTWSYHNHHYYMKHHLKRRHSNELASKNLLEVYQGILMEARARKASILGSTQEETKKIGTAECELTMITDEQIKLHCGNCNKNFDMRRSRGLQFAINCPVCDLLCQFQCKKCEKLFPTNKRAKTHMRFVCYPRKYYKCDWCDYATSRTSHLRIHRLRCRLSTNDLTDNKIKSIQKRDKIPTIIANDQNYKYKEYCEKCEEAIDQPRARGQKYLENCRNCSHKLIFKCSKCNKLLQNSSSMREHVRTVCFPKEVFDCNHCNYITTRRNYFQRHILIKHSESQGF